MTRVLIAWIGVTDLNAPTQPERIGLGPLGQAATWKPFDEAVLLTNHPPERVDPFVQWLGTKSAARLHVRREPLTNPTDFAEIHQAAVGALDETRRQWPEAELTIHLSPGTPAMAAVWIILAKTRFPAELIESSLEHGTRVASVPFDISADFIPDLLRQPDQRLERLSLGLPPEAPEFDDIVHRSPVMKRLVAMARRVAPRSVPVLIEGESGTGKELLARAIHRASPRRERTFVAVNCGAIPAELVESALFGHLKGAFTGATGERKGYFEAADLGTLFLDEIGELPAAAQVKLLRVLQEGEVVRVGATAPVRVDVRIIAATNRDLTGEIRAGRFREDLFYRLAVAVLNLPPLQHRPGDVGLLVDHLLAVVNEESREDPGYVAKRLAPGARNLLLAHAWPGNVRELYNTLLRAALWTSGDSIRAEDVRDALLPSARDPNRAVLGRPLGEGFDLQAVMSEVARHYLGRALDEAQGSKTGAARLLGLPSYQTLTNWLARYGVGKGAGLAKG
jgi:transcriptional regulator with GAF, ATPase, and Fis domain